MKGLWLGKGCKLQIPAEVENHTGKRVFCLFFRNLSLSCVPAQQAQWEHKLFSSSFGFCDFCCLIFPNGLSSKFLCEPGLFYFQYQIRSGESRSHIIHYSCERVGFNIILVK